MACQVTLADAYAQSFRDFPSRPVFRQVSILDSNGLFRAFLDFGPNTFGRDPRWLELSARRSGTSNDLVTLTPRQRVGPVPTSLYSRTADVAAGFSGVLTPANLPPNIARLDVPQVFAAASFFNPPAGPLFTVGTTQRVANLNSDLLDGLDSTAFWSRSVNGITELIGPNQNSHALDVVLGSDRALRLQPGDSNLGSSIVVGSANNAIVAGVPGGPAGRPGPPFFIVTLLLHKKR